MFLVNSRYPLVTATPKRSGREVLHTQGHTFSRSYGANLPSSLTRVLSSALGCSPRLPVSVYGTVSSVIISEAFLGSMESISSGHSPPHHLLALSLRLSPTRPRVTAYGLEPLTKVRMIYPSPSLLGIKHAELVQEYLPVFHRLRLSASA